MAVKCLGVERVAGPQPAAYQWEIHVHAADRERDAERPEGRGGRWCVLRVASAEIVGGASYDEAPHGGIVTCSTR
ncbi:hypothetical protein GCM10009733_093630 [Nonomuraea maheshkhaliensis]|uniref:Uncharacterized protein n=1 Tax=Nonomuraea maheshkhaliensis TaxID=419590 RepID=A0ABN2H5M8_9ACTN